MHCDDFIARLDDPGLQEGGTWPRELISHACGCSRCSEVLTIFQSIPSEVAALPRAKPIPMDGDSLLISVHEGLPLAPRWRALLRVMAAMANAGHASISH